MVASDVMNIANGPPSALVRGIAQFFSLFAVGLNARPDITEYTAEVWSRFKHILFSKT
jgi:hypothetical protein